MMDFADDNGLRVSKDLFTAPQDRRLRAFHIDLGYTWQRVFAWEEGLALMNISKPNDPPGSLIGDGGFETDVIDGEHNLDFQAICHLVVVNPETSYEFSAWLRTDAALRLWSITGVVLTP
jgi:hypothetical protein